MVRKPNSMINKYGLPIVFHAGDGPAMFAGALERLRLGLGTRTPVSRRRDLKADSETGAMDACKNAAWR